MSPANKKAESPTFRRLVAAAIGKFRSAPLVRQIIIVVATAAVLVAGSIGVWAKVRSHVQSQAEYLVDVTAVEITPPPEWIRTKIQQQVIQFGGLPEKLSVLDDHLAERLSHAFALHPWVERVNDVHTSYPAQIQVNLSYRKPVAMVAVPGGLLPIDSEGVVLPTEDFTPQAAQKYPRVVGITSSPLGPIGTPWGDSLVEAAAKLAQLLSDQWQSLELHHILVQQEINFENGQHVELRLVTRGKIELVWGSAIGQEAADEPEASAKLQRLVQLAKNNGGLDAAAPNSRNLRR